MKDRIKEVRKSSPYGRTQEAFAEFLGIPKQNLSSYEIGRRNPSDAVVQLICQKCGVNEEWLRTGKGAQKKDTSIEFGDICGEIGINDPKAKEAIMKYSKLSPADKELFWNFVERFIKPKAED